MIARRLLLACLVVATTLGRAHAWDDVTGDRDMPWMGKGGRARYFRKHTSCMMCPTGDRVEERWSTGGWFGSGNDPYAVVQTAMRFLMKDQHAREMWPQAFGEGSVGGADVDVIEPRAAPYRFTVVMIEPTVVVMRYDLGALVKLGSAGNDQEIGTPWLNQSIEYGTRLPATGTLLWFSPDAAQGPTPVAGDGLIRVKNVELALRREGDDWVVTRR